MRKTYLALILLFTVVQGIFAQQNCSDAQLHIVYAFNNAKLSLEANNLTHLKHYAEKSLQAFERVNSSLGNCDCTNVADLTYMSIDKLSKVEEQEKMHEAQYFVGKAKKFAQEIITELDHCTIYTSKEEELVELSALEREQLKLKQEQEAIKQKQEELKQKLAEQARQEQYLAKEQLIIQTEAALNQNLKAYQDLLEACDCKKNVTIAPEKSSKDSLINKSIRDIRKHYLESFKTLTTDYIATLDDCEN